MRSSKALEMTQNQFIDWRGLCEELVEELESAGRGFQITDAAPETLSAWADEAFRAADRARAALAQPEPEVVGPTAQEIQRLWKTCGNPGAFARAVLARWGHPAPAPVVEVEHG